MERIFTCLLLLFIARTSQACYADFSFNHGCTGDTVFFHAMDGFAAYSWDYGDTASGAVNVSHEQAGYHVYTTPGDYYVTLFVNVGAEWDYRTNLIHIGNNCFQAAFDALCSTSLHVNFYDRSYGHHGSQVWNFGDPASGIYNTDTNAIGVHQFTAEGNYVITYIIMDGLEADTIQQSITVDSTCTSAVITNATVVANCVNTPITIYASYSPSVTNQFWNFGDPASGIANFSTDAQPVHTFSAPGNYLITMIYTDGTFTDTLTKMLPVIDCSVWPGDANGDGEVNAEDIFPIGLYYSQHGPQRNAATTTWTGQACTSWFETNGFGNIMYLQDVVDMKMADCNGDSTINSSDIAAIQANYGRKHRSRNNNSAMLVHSPTDPTLAVHLSSSTIVAGGTITATISLGDAVTSSGFVYGGSLSLLFNPALVDTSIPVSFNLGWLDSTGTNMLMFCNGDVPGGKIDLAFVKKNHISESGYGPVATITFHTKSTASGNFDLQIAPNAKIFNSNIGNWGGSGNIEAFRTMYLQNASATIQASTGIDQLSDKGIIIYPNPSNGLLFIGHPTFNQQLTIEVFNALGQKFMELLHQA